MSEKEIAKSNSRIQELINGGAEIAGSAVGGALGFLAAGPVGAALGGAGGAASANVLKQIGEEVFGRLLSPREKIRLGGALAFAASEINQRIKKGDKIRNDGFFNKNSQHHSYAEEVVESVLLKCQREPEECKIPYMGYLISNISFDEEIKIQMAHQIIKIAEQLTYRQLCIMKLSVIKESFKLHDNHYRDQEYFTQELYQLLHECLDLYYRGLINFGGKIGFGLSDVTPGKMKVQGLGADIYNLMALEKIPIEELISIANSLS
jgi:hypothetical protein